MLYKLKQVSRVHLLAIDLVVRLDAARKRMRSKSMAQ